MELSLLWGSAWYPRCDTCRIVRVPPGSAAGGRVAFRAPGVCPAWLARHVVAVGAALLLLLSLVSGYSLMIFVRLHSGLLGAV